jgi:hypothetical protein
VTRFELLALALVSFAPHALAQPTPPAPASAPVPAPSPAPVPAPSPAAPTPAPVQPAPVPPIAPAAQPHLSVFRVHLAAGIDPSVASLVAQQLRRTAVLQGYTVTDDAVADAAIARAGASGALSPDRAADLVRGTGAAYGVFANVQSSGGAYVVSIQLVPSAGGVPANAEARGVSSDLYDAIDRAVRANLPPAASLAPPTPAPAPAPALAPTPAPEEYGPARFRLAVATEGAFGVSGGSFFYNHLAGVRFDRRFDDRAAMGLQINYANLKGKDGRVSNFLPWAMFEYRVDLGSGFAVPLRYAMGYLPKNGPVARASAGLAIPISDAVDLNLDLLAPTLWITHERPVMSLDVAAEIGWSF